jgi:hypothetical protein
MLHEKTQKEIALEQNGWTVECLSPFEIRHNDSGSFASGLAAEIIASALTPVSAPLCLYQDSDTPAPPVAPWPLPDDLIQAHLNGTDIVTFTALVPLEKLVYGDIDELNAYCRQAFGDDIEIGNTEYRVNPSASMTDEWDSRFIGDVALQVTCTLHPGE